MGGRSFTPPFSVRQQKILALVPKVTAAASIVASLYIVFDCSRARHRKKVYNRLLLSMSVMDFIYSVKSFISTWPMPEQTLFVWGAKGTFETCTAAGFLGHGGALSSALYNGSLTLYFLLSITFSWREEALRKRFEPFLHAIPLLVGWSTAVVGIPKKLYNPLGWTCWIGTYPPGCGTNYPCARGDPVHVDMYRWVFFHAELWFVFLLSGVAMALMVWSVRRKERRMNRYNAHDPEPPGSRGERISLSRKVAVQSFLYMFFFFLAWIFPMVQFVVSQKTGHLYFPLLCLTVIFSPLQGFFDALIYLRPRYLMYRRQQSRNLAAIRALTTHDDHVEGEIYDPQSEDSDTKMFSSSPDCPPKESRPGGTSKPDKSGDTLLSSNSSNCERKNKAEGANSLPRNDHEPAP